MWFLWGLRSEGGSVHLTDSVPQTPPSSPRHEDSHVSVLACFGVDLLGNGGKCGSQEAGWDLSWEGRDSPP